jgi:MFS family permease
MAAGFGGYYALTGNYAVLMLTDLHGTMADVARCVAVFNVGMLIGAVACGTLATRIGVVAAVAVPAVLMALLAPLYVGWYPSLLTLGAFFAGMFGAGYSGVSPLLLTGLFPAAIRARCVGLVYHLGAVPAAFVPMAIAAMAEHKVASLPVAIGCTVAAFQLAMASMIVFAPTDAPSEAPAEGPVALAH